MSAVPASARADAPWSDRIVEGFYGRIAVRETRGRGLPVVLIHGQGSTRDVFRLQMSDALGARYRMVAVDLPGQGASDAPASPDGRSLTSVADAVIDTVERLGLERFALLGWQLGGHVALEIAASSPGAVGVMLVGTPALPSADGEAPGGADAEPAADLFAAMVAGMTADQRSLASSVGLPLAVVNGAADPALQHGPLAPSSALWENRPHVFPFAGQAPFLDAPEVFNATLARFLHHLESDACAVGPRFCFAG